MNNIGGKSLDQQFGPILGGKKRAPVKRTSVAPKKTFLSFFKSGGEQDQKQQQKQQDQEGGKKKKRRAVVKRSTSPTRSSKK